MSLLRSVHACRHELLPAHGQEPSAGRTRGSSAVPAGRRPCPNAVRRADSTRYVRAVGEAILAQMRTDSGICTGTPKAFTEVARPLTQGDASTAPKPAPIAIEASMKKANVTAAICNDFFRISPRARGWWPNSSYVITNAIVAAIGAKTPPINRPNPHISQAATVLHNREAPFEALAPVARSLGDLP